MRETTCTTMNIAEIIALKDLTVFNNNASINRTFDRHVPIVPAKMGHCAVRSKRNCNLPRMRLTYKILFLKLWGLEMPSAGFVCSVCFTF